VLESAYDRHSDIDYFGERVYDAAEYNGLSTDMKSDGKKIWAFEKWTKNLFKKKNIFKVNEH
jgi:hypothetical protein